MASAMEYLEELQVAALTAEYGAGYVKRLAEEQAFLDSRKQKEFHQARRNSILDGLSELQRKTRRFIMSRGETDKFLTTQSEVEEARRRVSERRYSQVESPFFIDVIEAARLRVEAGYNEMSAKLASKSGAPSKDYMALYKKVIIGSLPDMSFWASAIRVPGSEEYIIAFNAGLPQFLSRFSRILTRLAVLVPMKDVERLKFGSSESADHYAGLARAALRAPENEYVGKNFVGAIGDYFGFDFGMKYNHKEFFGADLMISEAKTISSEVFILAHEYAHILDDHAIKQWQPLGIVRAVKKVEAGTFPKEVEFAADMVAAQILLAPLRNLPDSAPQQHREMLADSLLRGMVHVFTCATLVEYFQDRLDRKPSVPSYHPSTSERLSLLVDLLDKASFGRLPHNIARSLALAEALVDHFEDRYSSS